MAASAEIFRDVRSTTERLCDGLSPEDCNLQAMPETSPVKWHLAHTAWFFDTFVLEPFQVDYLSFDPVYAVLFNSYYNGVGEQFPRAQRNLLSRPSMDEVLAYRHRVDEAVLALLAEGDHEQAGLIAERVELGLHHEAQHQELILTDLKYCLFQNPVFPAFRESTDTGSAQSCALEFIEFEGGDIAIGHGEPDFGFDNEKPLHKQYVHDFRIANRLVTNGEFLEFVEAGGYANPEHWLADGWAVVQSESWRHPLYWGRIESEWYEYTLNGLVPLDLHKPLSHVSFYEANAYASWAGKRLPTEIEWERAAQAEPLDGNMLDRERFHPQAATESG